MIGEGTNLHFGDGPAASLSYRVTEIDVPNDALLGVALDPDDSSSTVIDHTYPSPTNAGAPWVARAQACCRISNQVNNADGEFRLQTLVSFGTGNAAPVSGMCAFKDMPADANTSFRLPATDPDPSTRLTYRLATPTEAASGQFVQPGPPWTPSALQVDPSSGVVSWDTRGTAIGQLWSCQVIVEDRDSVTSDLRTQVAVDFLIRISGGCAASDDRFDGVLLTWSQKACVSGYRVWRDGTFRGFVAASSDSFLDQPETGSYRYCLEPFGPTGFGPFCCDSGTRLGPPAPPAPSSAQMLQPPLCVEITWRDVQAEAGYRVYRDGALHGPCGENCTSMLDAPPIGWHRYCVEAFNGYGPSGESCFDFEVTRPCGAGGGRRRLNASAEGRPTASPAVLAIRGAAWEPVRGDLAVEVSLPRPVPAQLELLDLAGRRIASRWLEGGIAGGETLELHVGGVLGSGVYLLRLVQGSESAVVKVAVLR